MSKLALDTFSGSQAAFRAIFKAKGGFLKSGTSFQLRIIGTY
jgi:hypothetical protein